MIVHRVRTSAAQFPATILITSVDRASFLLSLFSDLPKSWRKIEYLLRMLHQQEHEIMFSHRTRAAATGTLLMVLTSPNAAGAQPVPRFAQPDVPGLAAITRARPFRTDQDARSPIVEREHVRAQRIINRVCTGC
ncbi:hypothetical protein [Methylobacterium oryzae]